MAVRKQRPWTLELELLFDIQNNILLDLWDVNSDVKTAIKKICNELIEDYTYLGCHLIGEWDYDEETETYSNEGVSQLFHYIISKYKPYLLVFTSEYTKLSEQVIRSHTGSNDGVSRSASENSPITAQPITSAPTEASEWTINNPDVKGGSQYNRHFADSENVTDPLVQKRIMEFNVGELNLTLLGRRIIQSLTEEYRTIY